MVAQLVCRRALSRSLAMLAMTLLPFAAACGDVLLDVAHVASADPPALERTLTVTQAGSLDVSVVDQAFPSALASLRVAVTQGSTVIKSLPGAGTLTFDAAPGDYVIRLVGRPDAATRAGAASVEVTPHGATQPVLLTLTHVFQATASNPLQVQVDEPLTIPAAGDYSVTLSDQAFPAPLASLSAAVFRGGTLIAVINPGAPVVLASLAASGPDPAAQYKLTILASAAPAPGAGLYGVRMIGAASGTTVLDVSGPVGSLAPAQNVLLPSAGALSLQLTDFLFPGPLASLGAALTAGGQLLTRQFGAGTATSAASGSVQLWRTASAGSGAGSYLIEVFEGSTRLYSDAQGVTPAAAAGPVAYAFPVVLPAAGTYSVQVTDFQFPAALQGLQFAVVQDGQILRQASTGGSTTFIAPNQDPATLLVIAQPPTAGIGLIGAELAPSAAGGANLLDVTQAVGGVFQSLQVNDLFAGRYDVTLTDANWPVPFQTLAVALTRGGQVAGKIFGSGSFQADLAPGNYIATFIAAPAAIENAGFYALSIQSAAPTVTLSVDQPTVQSGQGVRLSWTSTGASACVASGAWSGNQPPTGTGVAVGPLASTSLFTLVCNGPGGASAPASVTVTVTPAPSSRGGGGAVDAGTLAVLLALLYMRRARRLANRFSRMPAARAAHRRRG